MVQKRPFDDEELCELSSKQPRHLEHNRQLVPIFEYVPSEDACLQFQALGEGGFTKNKSTGDEKLTNDFIHQLPMSYENNIEASVPRRIPVSPWVTSSPRKEGVGSEAPGHVTSEYFSLDCPTRKLTHSEELYSFLLDHPSRKPIPIGADHQADISTLDRWDTKTSDNDDEDKFVGTCVLPMPESGQPDGNVGNGRTDCSCIDVGSVRCVRQHILEAREELRTKLGQDKFLALGLCDMGEEVAEKWSEEEEQLYHEAVFSNPASLGRNFWHNLDTVFPIRTRKDIVSYYFNVFMLRKRAEQNRHDPLNVDSDDDEWPDRDDCGDNNGPEEEEDDEDSVVESPDENISNPMFQLPASTPWDERGNDDVEDDSCTSSDTGPGSQMKVDNGHGYVLEPPCYGKVWDSGYMNFPKNQGDFLPTCNMIEEVFGNGAWNYKGRDGKGLI